MRALDRREQRRPIAAVWSNIIEHHRDVAAQLVLDLDCPLRSQMQTCTGPAGGKLITIGRPLHDEGRALRGLIASAIGEMNGLRVEPASEAAVSGDRIRTRGEGSDHEKTSGREALDHVSVWLQKVVTQPAVLRTLQPDTFYEDPRFAEHDRVRFEPHRGAG